jgi:hypothetical protein
MHCKDCLSGVNVLHMMVDLFIYHLDSAVGPSSMPCNLMVGFFAFATSFDIHVDHKELEGMETFGSHFSKPTF